MIWYLIWIFLAKIKSNPSPLKINQNQSKSGLDLYQPLHFLHHFYWIWKFLVIKWIIFKSKTWRNQKPWKRQVLLRTHSQVWRAGRTSVKSWMQQTNRNSLGFASVRSETEFVNSEANIMEFINSKNQITAFENVHWFRELKSPNHRFHEFKIPNHWIHEFICRNHRIHEFQNVNHWIRDYSLNFWFEKPKSLNSWIQKPIH